MEEDTKNQGFETPVESQQPETSFRDEFLGQGAKESSSEKKIVIGILALLIIGGVVGAIVFIRARSQKPESVLPASVVMPTTVSTPTPSPTPTLSPSPSPTPQPSTALKAYKIQVLNGSGVAGAASKVVKLLETEGATGVVAGNAASYNYETTEVSLKPAIPATVFAIVKKALAGYAVIEGKDLEATSSFDLVVTVGAK